MFHVGNGGVELQILRRVRGIHAMAVALVFPQCADTGKQWMDFLQSPRIRCDFGGQGRVLGEHEGRIDLPFGHQFDDFASLALDGYALNTAGCRLLAGLRGAVAFLALDDEAVRDEVCEDVAVHAMGCAGIEGFASDAGAGI